MTAAPDHRIVVNSGMQCRSGTFSAVFVDEPQPDADQQDDADGWWIAGTLIAVVPAVVWVLAALRRGHAGVDLIAVLALGGTLAVGEYLAGSLIALMLATGRTLEAAAQRRASHDLRALLEHAPRSARRRIDSEVRTVPLAEVAVGDLLVVGPGEVVPVDGRWWRAAAVLDESVLTGEPLQVERSRGEAVRSGVVNAGGAFDLRATATEQDSTYAGIVRLARQAGAEIAHRWCVWPTATPPGSCPCPSRWQGSPG